jgi:hypothetical protein
LADYTESLLREALERLAADAETQAAYLGQIGTWPSLDELALTLDDVAAASESWASPALRGRVRDLMQALDEMSGAENASHWRPEALHEPEWVNVRRLAADALATFE